MNDRSHTGSTVTKPKPKKPNAAPGGAADVPFNPDEAFDEHIGAEGGAMSRGQLALEALVFYRAHDLPCPDWALTEIEECYESFKTGAPASGFVREARTTPATRSLGEAFGIADIKGQHLQTRRMRALMAPVLGHLFSTGKYPRSEAGYEAAGAALGLSPKQVKQWVPKR